MHLICVRVLIKSLQYNLKHILVHVHLKFLSFKCQDFLVSLLTAKDPWPFPEYS